MRVWCEVHGWGALQSWYQSRTDCRKPLLLADVEFSVCKTILKPTNYLRKFWVGFFLLLTWYRSNSESSYLVLFAKVLLSCLLLQTFRFSGLGSTSSTPCQVAMSQNVYSFVWVLAPQWLEHKVPDCARIHVCWLMWFLNHVRITLSFRISVHEADL